MGRYPPGRALDMKSVLSRLEALELQRPATEPADGAIRERFMARIEGIAARLRSDPAYSEPTEAETAIIGARLRSWLDTRGGFA
jgi:hypothetical protein